MLENDAVLGRIEQRLRDLEVPLSITLWNGRRLAAAPAPRVSVTVHSPKVLASLVHPTMGKLARHYVEQELDVEGEARQILRARRSAVGHAGRRGAARARRLRKWIGHTRIFDSKRDPPSLRRQRRVLRAVARPAAGVLVRLLPPRRRHARRRAGAEARPHLPQAPAEARRALPRHRLRLGRARHLGGASTTACTRPASRCRENQYEYARRRIDEAGSSDRVRGAAARLSRRAGRRAVRQDRERRHVRARRAQEPAGVLRQDLSAAEARRARDESRHHAQLGRTSRSSAATSARSSTNTCSRAASSPTSRT